MCTNGYIFISHVAFSDIQAFWVLGQHQRFLPLQVLPQYGLQPMCTVRREHPLQSAVSEDPPAHAHRAWRNHCSEPLGPPGTYDTLRHRQRTRSSQEAHALKYTHTETLPPRGRTDGDRRALSTQREVLHSSYSSPKPPATPQRGGRGEKRKIRRAAQGGGCPNSRTIQDCCRIAIRPRDSTLAIL